LLRLVGWPPYSYVATRATGARDVMMSIRSSSVTIM
jgi:hypothetical protein